jgi:hypothetical protein
MRLELHGTGSSRGTFFARKLFCPTANCKFNDGDMYSDKFPRVDFSNGTTHATGVFNGFRFNAHRLSRELPLKITFFFFRFKVCVYVTFALTGDYSTAFDVKVATIRAIAKNFNCREMNPYSHNVFRLLSAMKADSTFSFKSADNSKLRDL